MNAVSWLSTTNCISFDNPTSKTSPGRLRVILNYTELTELILHCAHQLFTIKIAPEQNIQDLISKVFNSYTAKLSRSLLLHGATEMNEQTNFKLLHDGDHWRCTLEVIILTYPLSNADTRIFKPINLVSQ